MRNKNRQYRFGAVLCAAIAGVGVMASHSNAAAGDISYVFRGPGGLGINAYTGAPGTSVTLSLFVTTAATAFGGQPAVRAIRGDLLSTKDLSSAFNVIAVNPVIGGFPGVIALSDQDGDGDLDVGSTSVGAPNNSRWTYTASNVPFGTPMAFNSNSGRFEFALGTVTYALPTNHGKTSNIYWRPSNAAGGSSQIMNNAIGTSSVFTGTFSSSNYLAVGGTVGTGWSTQTNNGTNTVSIVPFKLATTNAAPSFTGETVANDKFVINLDLVNGPFSFTKTISVTDDAALQTGAFTETNLPGWVNRVVDIANKSVTYYGTAPYSELPPFGSVNTLTSRLTVTDAGGLTDTSDLVFNIVPEPTFLAVMGLGAMGLLRRRRVG